MLFSEPCGATGVPEHPADSGSSYCDIHRLDYRRQKRRWYSARNNFRRGATKREPGSWEDFLADIQWSPPPGHGVLIDAQGVRTLRSIADALTSSARTIDYVLRKPMEARTKEQVVQQRLEAQLAITRAVDALQRLAKREPHALRALSNET